MTQKSVSKFMSTFDLSLDWANALYGWSNIALIIGVILSLFGTIGNIWASSIRDKYSDQRISNNETQTASANEHSRLLEVELAKTNERAALADARAAEANRLVEEARRDTATLSREAALSSERTGKLELETETQRKLTAEATARGKTLELDLEKTRLELARLKAPRVLTSIQQERMAEKLKQFAGIPFDCFVSEDPEPIGLMVNISDALTKAGWVHKPIEGHAAELTTRGKPAAGLVILSGIEIQIHKTHFDDWSKGAQALETALRHEGISSAVKGFEHMQEHPNAIHIKIGKKP